MMRKGSVAKTPLVSVITPAYNSDRYIKDCISSVKNQTIEDWEHIIVDDASSDETWAIVQDAASQDARIKPIQLPQNSGAAITRNTAIEAAKGRFIAFLDADDIWLPRKLEIQLAFMQERNSAFTYTAYERFTDAGDKREFLGIPETATYTDLLKSCYIGCLTVIYDTNITGKVYMSDVRKRQDYGLWLRLLKLVPQADGLNQVLARYRISSNSLSFNKKSAARYQWVIYREVEKLSFPIASYFFAHYAVRGLMRQRMPKLAVLLGLIKRPDELDAENTGGLGNQVEQKF